MLNTLRKRLQGEEGFTLVELLVVILIIGILAAIAIPSFLNQKGKGEDAAAKSSAREASTAMETYYTDNGSYANATVTKLKLIENTLPADAGAATGTAAAGMMKVTVLPDAATGTGYTVTVYSKPSGRAYSITKDATAGTVTRSCDSPNTGGCNSSSGW